MFALFFVLKPDVAEHSILVFCDTISRIHRPLETRCRFFFVPHP
jgi:hypothetical protein